MTDRRNSSAGLVLGVIIAAGWLVLFYFDLVTSIGWNP